MLNDEQLEAYLGLIREGMPKKPAAAKSGIGRRTVQEWEQNGREALAKRENGEPLTPAEERYVRFLLDFEEAWDLGEAALLDRAQSLADAGKSTWNQPITVLERTRRADWGKRDTLELGGLPIQIVVEGRPPREVNGRGRAELGEDGASSPSALPAAPSAASVPE